MREIRTQRWLFYAIVSLFLLASCTSGKKEQKEIRIPVQTETVRRSLNDAGTTYVGQVEEQSATAVSFTSMGTLNRVFVSEGQWVKRGQLLATIDPTSAQNALASAKAQLSQAHDALERMKMLHDQGSLTDIKWVEVQSQVAQAEAQYRLMEKQVKDCRLLAPVSGVIGSGVKSAGESALPAEPVARILNIDRVKVRFSLPEQEMSQLHSEAHALISVAALGGETFHSHSLTKGVEGDLMTHTYTVYAHVNNPGHRLLPGMVTSVTFSSSNANPQISVPARCVGQNPSGSQFVWTVVNGKAHQQKVKVGESRGNRLVINEGLKEGDKVITEGYQKVGEGSSVEG